jgi:hypothetical protein
MIVVSDTSPITALLAVEKADLFKQLFGEVVTFPTQLKPNCCGRIPRCPRGYVSNPCKIP